MKFIKEVLQDIEPEQEYKKKIMENVNDMISRINKNSKDIKAILGGSGAKGTWLKTFDADIFVKFSYKKYKDKSDKLSDILEKKLKRIFPKISRLHGSRDYFQIKRGRFTFEIVPILSITKASQARNITDVSPLHSKWVLKHKKLQKEIRLLKQFCKAQNVYGAESYINGFSGYVCEILVVYYGSFLKLVRAACKWKEKTVIDVEGYYKRKDVFRELNTSKLVSPLIVIDPVQADRNASAALSEKNFFGFISSCKRFVRSPSKKFFVEKDFSMDEIIKKYKKRKVVFLSGNPLRGKEDIIGCRLVKALEFFNRELLKHDFKVYDYGWHWGREVVFYYVLDSGKLPKTVERVGPPIIDEINVKAFKRKHKKTFIRNKKINAIDQRKYREPEKLLRLLFRNKYLDKKVKQVKII